MHDDMEIHEVFAYLRASDAEKAIEGS